MVLKFTESRDAQDLKKRLLATGSDTIVLASPHDGIWGAGMSVKQIMKSNGEIKGKNQLGAALMEIRKRIREDLEERAKKVVEDVDMESTELLNEGKGKGKEAVQPEQNVKLIEVLNI